MTPTRGATTGLVLAAVLALSACSGGEAQEPETTPEDVLAAAKKSLDGTEGVRISLATEELPKGVDGILSAKGVGTHAPAFEGDLEVAVGGFPASVPVVAVDGKVHAKLPFTTKFVEVDPGAYAAPDPAGLMDPDSGLSSLLTEAEDVEEGEKTRSGKDVLAGYTATVPGDVVASIIPSASADTDFDATFTIDDEELLREAVLTGPFYPGADAVTYTITFDNYGTTADITAP